MMMGGEDEDLPSIQERNPLCADCSAEGEQYKRNALSNKSALERRIGGVGALEKQLGFGSFLILFGCLFTGPVWVALNLGVVLCHRCCNVHQTLGHSVSQLKSFQDISDSSSLSDVSE